MRLCSFPGSRERFPFFKIGTRILFYQSTVLPVGVRGSLSPQPSFCRSHPLVPSLVETEEKGNIFPRGGDFYNWEVKEPLPAVSAVGSQSGGGWVGGCHFWLNGAGQPHCCWGASTAVPSIRRPEAPLPGRKTPSLQRLWH